MKTTKISNVLGALILAGLLGGAQSTSKGVGQLQGNKQSIRVGYLSFEAKEVGYLVTKAVPVDNGGKSIAGFAAKVGANQSVFISGRISLMPTDQDLGDLRAQSEQILGQGTSIVEITPLSFQMWLFAGDTLVWERPNAGGQTKGIAVFALISKNQNVKLDNLRLVTALTWGETLPPLKSKVVVEWQSVVKEIEVELKAMSSITEDRLTSLAGKAIVKGAVRVDRKSEEGKDAGEDVLAALLVQYMRELLLTKPLPTPERKDQPKDSLSWSVSYNLRKDIQAEKLQDVFDLSVTKRVDHVTVFVTPMSVVGQ